MITYKVQFNRLRLKINSKLKHEKSIKTKTTVCVINVYQTNSYKL